MNGQIKVSQKVLFTLQVLNLLYAQSTIIYEASFSVNYGGSSSFVVYNIQVYIQPLSDFDGHIVGWFKSGSL